MYFKSNWLLKVKILSLLKGELSEKLFFAMGTQRFWIEFNENSHCFEFSFEFSIEKSILCLHFQREHWDDAISIGSLSWGSYTGGGSDPFIATYKSTTHKEYKEIHFNPFGSLKKNLVSLYTISNGWIRSPSSTQELKQLVNRFDRKHLYSQSLNWISPFFNS